MYRNLIEELKSWKDGKKRKPLILRGARQVGKTWLLQEFGRTCFDNMAYVSMEDNDAMSQLFEGSLNPDRLIRGIAAQTGERISPHTTLIIFDEVQAVPRALTSLKYFCEEAPEYAVIAAGSLLGVALNAGISFPVGKVTFMDLYPLSFTEFLLALGEESLEKIIRMADYEMMPIFKEKLKDLIKTYYFVGGMPEAVASFVQFGDFSQVRSIQQDILNTYQGDFAKHAGALLGERCRLVFNSLPRHLAKENKKFVYGMVKKGARGRELDDALQFLEDAGLVIKVKRISTPALPLSAYAEETMFKLFCVDVGLLGALSGLGSETIIEGNSLFTHFKGALAEQYVCQQLICEGMSNLFYWSAEKSSGEIDFLIEKKGGIIPIEVKAEENLRSKSLAVFAKTFGIEKAVRFSLSDYRRESWMENIPLYAVSGFTRL